MIKKYLKSEFLRNVATLMTGTALAQAVPLLISPILSRIYSPDDFGVLAMFMAVTAIIGVISTGRYELAIMLPKEDKDSKSIVILSLSIVVSISLLALILIVIFHDLILSFFKAPELGPWLYLAPVGILFMGVYQTYNYWSTRNKTFARNAASRVSQTSTTAGVNLLMGFGGMGASGLISGTLIGQVAGGIVLAWKDLIHPGKFKESFSRKLISKNAKRYSNFVKINAPHAFVDSLQNYGIVYVIVAFFTNAVLGSYNFAFRVLKAPVGLIGASFYQVFYQKASRAFEEGQNLQPMVLKIYRNLFLSAFPFFVILFIFTPEIFSFVFGEKWIVAGNIARILTPMIFLNLLLTPVTCVAIVLNRQGGAFLIACADVIFKAGSIIAGGIMGDYELAFLIMSILCSSLLIFALYWYYSIANPKRVKSY